MSRICPLRLRMTPSASFHSCSPLAAWLRHSHTSLTTKLASFPALETKICRRKICPVCSLFPRRVIHLRQQRRHGEGFLRHLLALHRPVRGGGLAHTFQWVFHFVAGFGIRSALHKPHKDPPFPTKGPPPKRKSGPTALPSSSATLAPLSPEGSAQEAF